jgi:hypothetical protein
MVDYVDLFNLKNLCQFSIHSVSGFCHNKISIARFEGGKISRDSGKSIPGALLEPLYSF